MIQTFFKSGDYGLHWGWIPLVTTKAGEVDRKRIDKILFPVMEQLVNVVV